MTRLPSLRDFIKQWVLNRLENSKHLSTPNSTFEVLNELLDLRTRRISHALRRKLMTLHVPVLYSTCALSMIVLRFDLVKSRITAYSKARQKLFQSQENKFSVIVTNKSLTRVGAALLKTVVEWSVSCLDWLPVISHKLFCTFRPLGIL